MNGTRLPESALEEAHEVGAGSPRPAPAASLMRQLVRSLRDCLDEVSTAGRHDGEVAAAVRVVLAEVEMAPLRWLAEQQARDGRDGRG